MTGAISNPTNRPPPRVALETTLLVHGVPREQALPLARELDSIIRRAGALPALVGVVRGKPVVGMSEAQLEAMLGGGAERDVPKLNTGSLGLALSRGTSGATTVSATMELAAGAGVRIFATGGIGGIHKGLAEQLDISTDLLAFTRFPVAVVASGCKSILDVVATRELLETLGVPVVGFKTDRFPAFYSRDGGTGVDARFDDVPALAEFLRFELPRTSRGVVVCNAIPAEHEIEPARFITWLAEAEAKVRGTGKVEGRRVTPAILGALHEISKGATLKANIELVKSNTDLAAKLAVAMG